MDVALWTGRFLACSCLRVCVYVNGWRLSGRERNWGGKMRFDGISKGTWDFFEEALKGRRRGKKLWADCYRRRVWKWEDLLELTWREHKPQWCGCVLGMYLTDSNFPFFQFARAMASLKAENLMEFILYWSYIFWWIIYLPVVWKSVYVWEREEEDKEASGCWSCVI